MGKVWVLDTETKGTGAEMLPLEKVLGEPTRERISVVRRRRGAPSVDEAPAKAPWRFRVVDVMSQEVLADGIDARATVEVLGGVRSVVDVHVFAWDEQAGDWRLLTLGEQKALWKARPSR